MKSLKISQDAWDSFKNDLNAKAADDQSLNFGVLIGQTHNIEHIVYDILPLTSFKPQTDSKELADYLKTWDEAGNNLGEWLNGTLTNIKMMQVYGMRIIGLVIHSSLANFKLTDEQFLTYLGAASTSMPSASEINILLLDASFQKIDQAVVLDVGKRKTKSTKFTFENKLEKQVSVKSQLAFTRTFLVPKNSKTLNATLIEEQVKDYCSRISYFIAAHQGAILLGKQSLESLIKENKINGEEEVNLELYYDETPLRVDKHKELQKASESRSVTLSGAFEVRCYASPKNTIAEILTSLAQDFMETFRARSEIVTFESKSFEASTQELEKNKSSGFNLARRVFLKLKGHDLLYQDYLSASESEDDTVARVLDFTGINVEVVGDYEVANLSLQGEKVAKKIKEEHKKDELNIRSSAASGVSNTGEENKNEKIASKINDAKDSSDLIKKLTFVVICLLALAALRFYTS